MSGTFIADLRHFLTEDGELIDGPAPARLVAQHLCSIVEAATSVAMVRETHETNVWCRRRPSRKPCPGKIHAGLLAGEPSCISWHCPSCGDNGLIRGWKETNWDRTWQ